MSRILTPSRRIWTPLSRQRGFVCLPGGLGAGRPSGGGGDPYYSSRVLGLHMDGANGSTTFTDNSPSPKTVTANGGAQISTAQSKFGGASGYFDGSGDWLSLPTTSDLYFPGDFTFESYLWKSASGLRTILHGNANGSLTIQISDSTIDIGRSNIAYVMRPAYTPTLNSWFYFALTRSGTTYRVFVDGILTGTVIDANGLVNAQFGIGGISGLTSWWSGYMDEVRITKGVAIYTADFTPPAAAFPDF